MERCSNDSVKLFLLPIILVLLPLINQAAAADDQPASSQNTEEISEQIKQEKLSPSPTKEPIDNSILIVRVSDRLEDVSKKLEIIATEIDEADPGFFSSLFGWILQIIAIAAGALVAFLVMKGQTEDSWKQLLVSIGITERLEREKAEREELSKIQDNENIQSILTNAIRTYMHMTSDYIDLSREAISSIPPDALQAKATLNNMNLPPLPPGMMENIHTYSNVLSASATQAMMAYHFYNFSLHYFDLNRSKVIRQIDFINSSNDQEKQKNTDNANILIKELKDSSLSFLDDIKSLCTEVIES